jgi:hypothetical protein
MRRVHELVFDEDEVDVVEYELDIAAPRVVFVECELEGNAHGFDDGASRREDRVIDLDDGATRVGFVLIELEDSAIALVDRECELADSVMNARWIR